MSVNFFTMLASGRKSEGTEGAYKPENSDAYAERVDCGKKRRLKA
jgi:hypothetical protein